MVDDMIIDGDLEFVEPDPRVDDPRFSYGIVEMPQPDDVLYKLTYDKDTGELKLGKSFVVKKFQWEEAGDRIFKEMFYPSTEEGRIKNSGPAKEIELGTSELAYPIVNNIKMPLSLRKAIFTTSKNGRKLQVHTEITRERASKFKVQAKEIEDYVINHRKN